MKIMQREQEPEPEPEIEARTRQTDVWTRDMDGQSSSHEGLESINQSPSSVRVSPRGTGAGRYKRTSSTTRKTTSLRGTAASYTTDGRIDRVG
jgi:hypothetical protein